MEKKKTSPKSNQEIIDDYDYLGNSSSSMDCTGLIPSEPQSEEELESYEAIYHHGAPDIKPKKD